MPNIVYARAAEDDLIEIAAYIARDKPDAARRWTKMIRDKCDLLATNPHMGQDRPDFGVPGCRCFSVGNYVVFFRTITPDHAGQPDGVAWSPCEPHSTVTASLSPQNWRRIRGRERAILDSRSA